MERLPSFSIINEMISSLYNGYLRYDMVIKRPLLLKNMEDITTNINNSTSVVNREIQGFSRTADRIHLVVSDIVDDVQSITLLAIKSPLFEKLKNVVAIIKGIRVFADVFMKKN